MSDKYTPDQLRALNQSVIAQLSDLANCDESEVKAREILSDYAERLSIGKTDVSLELSGEYLAYCINEQIAAEFNLSSITGYESDLTELRHESKLSHELLNEICCYLMQPKSVYDGNNMFAFISIAELDEDISAARAENGDT